MRHYDDGSTSTAPAHVAVRTINTPIACAPPVGIGIELDAPAVAFVTVAAARIPVVIAVLFAYSCLSSVGSTGLR